MLAKYRTNFSQLEVDGKAKLTNCFKQEDKLL